MTEVTTKVKHPSVVESRYRPAIEGLVKDRPEVATAYRFGKIPEMRQLLREVTLNDAEAAAMAYLMRQWRIHNHS
jgi:hypothetical protein